MPKPTPLRLLLLLLLATIPIILAASPERLTDGPKTVVFLPSPYHSITIYHSHVARAVAELGHDVWMVIPSYLLHKGYVNTSGVGIIPYQSVQGLEERSFALQVNKSLAGEAEDFFGIKSMHRDVIDNLLKNASLHEAIARKEPDLMILNSHPRFYASAVIPYKLNIPFAFLGAVYYAPGPRIPFSPGETPLRTLPYSNRMSFFQRVWNTLSYISLELFNPSARDCVAVYAPELPYLPLDVLVARAELWLVETDHVLDYPRPTLPNVKLVGGIATGQAGPLPPKFQTFMDESTEGVVIVAFGTNVLGLPEDIRSKLFAALLQLPMRSVVRSDLPSPDPRKILTSEWLPQNDLLGHVHTKVFISHCGLNSQYDALYHAVPVLAVPLRSDQPYNARRAQLKGFAEILNLLTCTTEDLYGTVMKLVQDSRYKKAAEKYSRLYRQQFTDPSRTAALWLDHVMQYGGGYMRSAGQDMPWYQFMLVDVLVFVLCCCLALCVCLYGCGVFLWRKVFGSKRKLD